MLQYASASLVKSYLWCSTQTLALLINLLLMTPFMRQRLLIRCQCQLRLLTTRTPGGRTAVAPSSLVDAAPCSDKGRNDTNYSPWQVLASGKFSSSAAGSAAADGTPPHPEVPGSNLQPAPPSNRAVSDSPAGWGDPLQELPEQVHDRTGPGQDASASPASASGAEVQQPGMTPEVPEPNVDAQEIPLQSPRDRKDWAAQDIPEEAPQHQMPGVPGDLIPPGVPPQVPQHPNSEDPPSVNPETVMSQDTMASGNGDGDREEPAGYWAGRVPGTPMACPTDKTKG